MTLNNAGTRLTITATRTAPQMTFAMTGGLMLAVDTPGANPAAALSRTVTLPAGQDYRNGAGAWTATITACGLISDGKEACTSYPHAGPSPPSPPNPPPSPPFTPPSPPSPPGAGSPPGASDGPVSSLTERVRSLSTGAVIGIVVGVIVAVALIGALLWYKLLRSNQNNRCRRHRRRALCSSRSTIRKIRSDVYGSTQRRRTCACVLGRWSGRSELLEEPKVKWEMLVPEFLWRHTRHTGVPFPTRLCRARERHG